MRIANTSYLFNSIIVFIGLSLLFWNCEKEEPQINDLTNQSIDFESKFKQHDFSEINTFEFYVAKFYQNL